LFAAEDGAAGALVVAADAGEFAGKAAELTEALFGILDRAQGLDVEGEFGGYDEGNVFGERNGVGIEVGMQVVGLLGGPAGLFAE
jgi:hypothetical protein